MMIWAHIEHSFRETFPTRMSEWFIAIVALNWGFVLAYDKGLFERVGSYDALLLIASQPMWSILCFTLGGGRLIVLLINGFWTRSAHARAVSSLLSALFFFEVSIGFAQGGLVTTGLAVYPVLFLMDSFNAVRALGDAGKLDAQRKVDANGTDS